MIDRRLQPGHSDGGIDGHGGQSIASTVLPGTYAELMMMPLYAGRKDLRLGGANTVR